MGVFEDVKSYSIQGPPKWAHGEVYLPVSQSVFGASPVSIVANIEGQSSMFERSLPALVHEVCGSCAVSKVARMESVVAKAVETPRSTAWLLGGFAALALGLAGAGIYGVVNHGVVRRTREFGVRLALGASRGQVVWLVIAANFRQVLAGAAVGLILAYALSALIRNLLFGIGPHDPLSYVLGPVVLAVMAALAAAAPAIRAGRIDPAQSLREG
ncbi:MAG: FtsX-like permease family protein [Bryobacterales bacterium]|nr:FtsX-like permease family protein [Bryobacterales bacterium]